MDIVKKITESLNSSIAKNMESLVTCTRDELPNIQYRVKYCQGLLKMIEGSSKNQESEINFE